MKMVAVPWSTGFMAEQTAKAMEMSKWCKTKGLVHDTDYTWYVDHKRRLTFFFFKKDSIATLFKLNWL